jgi:S-formylglutathione hydrolase FrmB
VSSRRSPGSHLADAPPGQGQRRRRWAIDRARGVPGAIVIVLVVVGAVFVVVTTLDTTSIDHGWFLIVAVTIAVMGMVVGASGRGWRWWATWGLGIAAAAASVTALAAWWVLHAGIVTEPYPASFEVWVGTALWATGVAVTGWWSGHGAVRAVRLVTAPVAVLAAFCLINAHYGYWPTVGALLDKPQTGEISAGAMHREVTHNVAVVPVHSAAGQFGPVAIPGGSVGFQAAGAYVWLPPDYFAATHAHLSVLLMLSGWPGDVKDWVRAGEVIKVANRWAATHRGAAPVMVFVDENGARSFDTECVNGPQGNAETYLTRTVPGYITRTLGIPDDPARWAVVGFSEGGTCAVDLGIRHPNVYGRFVDVAGDAAPNYGFGKAWQTTVLDLYGGNLAAYRSHNPLEVMATHHYFHVMGWFADGTGDQSHLKVAARLAAAARAAGIEARTLFGAGGHSWTFAGHAFDLIYPALVQNVSSSASFLRPSFASVKPACARRCVARPRSRYITSDLPWDRRSTHSPLARSPKTLSERGRPQKVR